MFRDRPLVVSLCISTVFHLSMVTLFSIGVWFEVKPTHYYTFEVVQVEGSRGPTNLPASDRARHQLRVPSLADSLGIGQDQLFEEVGQSLSLNRPTLRTVDLPEVELPTVMFADLDRLRLRKRSLEIRAHHAEYLADRGGDTWARFYRGLSGLGDALGRLPIFQRSPREEPSALHPVAVLAEGFEVYVEWMDEPRERELLFSPPIEALLRLDPDSLPTPLSFVFRVGPDGHVREVLQGSFGGEEELAVGVLRALAHYRFAPLPPGQTQDQHATLLISPVGEGRRL